MTKINGFEHLNKADRASNQGRDMVKEDIYRDIRLGLKNYTTNEFINICTDHNLAVAPVNTTSDVAKLDFVRNNMMKTTLPSGKTVPLFPAPFVNDYLRKINFTFKCSPRLGEHNNLIYKEIGYSEFQIDELKTNKII